jgi:LmbE family N-acetylglucosaminyl deacetylase
MPVAIWAPHPDDEIIGCYSVLATKSVDEVYYGIVDDGCYKSSSMFHFPFCFADPVKIQSLTWDILYAPDPYFDNHPDHQWFGHLAQRLFRQGRINRLIHYTTQMSASYISEVLNPTKKRDALNECYPEKSDLWRYDHRYWLFEGYCEWHRLVHD